MGAKYNLILRIFLSLAEFSSFKVLKELKGPYCVQLGHNDVFNLHKGTKVNPTKGGWYCWYFESVMFHKTTCDHYTWSCSKEHPLQVYEINSFVYGMLKEIAEPNQPRS